MTEVNVIEASCSMWYSGCLCTKMLVNLGCGGFLAVEVKLEILLPKDNLSCPTVCAPDGALVIESFKGENLGFMTKLRR